MLLDGFLHEPSAKVGHGGVLDRLAEGVLVIGLGDGCKELGEYLKGKKVKRLVASSSVLVFEQVDLNRLSLVGSFRLMLLKLDLVLLLTRLILVVLLYINRMLNMSQSTCCYKLVRSIKGQSCKFLQCELN